MDLYRQLSTSDTAHYKLLQLNPELVLAIEKGEEIVIKQSATLEPQLVMTSAASTWKIRQMNHSNLVLLMQESKDMNVGAYASGASDPEPGLVGVALCTYEYELTAMKGYIDPQMIPTYTGGDVPKKVLMAQLLDDSPVSPAEFAEAWSKLGGCELDGYAVILSTEVVSRVLYLVLTTLIAHQVDYNERLPVEDIINWLPSESPAVVRSVVAKFCQGDKLDNNAVVRWFGIEKLKDLKTQTVVHKIFLLKWKSSLPEFYSVPLDIAELKGYYFTPVDGMIQYIDKDLLANDIKVRVAQLLDRHRQWDYDEFVSLIDDLVPAGKKPDTLIMKHARKKRVGSKFVVTSR